MSIFALILSWHLASAIPISEFGSRTFIENEVVTVTGFPIQRDDGSWAIANIPSLKACCLARSKGPPVIVPCDHVFDDGEMGATVTVKGRMRHNEVGFRLEGATLESGARQFPYFSVAASVLGGLAAIIGFRRKGRKTV